MRNHSKENEFDSHENGGRGETHFHMNGFAQTRFDAEAKGNSEMAQNHLKNYDYKKTKKLKAKYLVLYFIRAFLPENIIYFFLHFLGSICICPFFHWENGQGITNSMLRNGFWAKFGLGNGILYSTKS